MTNLDIIVGGQFGSEAKGHTVQQVLRRRLQETNHVSNVRVGGPNAGHCAYDESGRRWALRQVPAGAANTLGPLQTAQLVIAAGSEIDPDVLKQEIVSLTEKGLIGNNSGKRLYVHEEATIISQRHKDAEADLVGQIGSTGKGIGAARASRRMRDALRLADDPDLIAWLNNHGVVVINNITALLQTSKAVVVEGTQGYGLGLHSGFYPKTTSGDCTAIDFLAQAQISPWRYLWTTVWVVARVYPIRVAGNSGPMHQETSWLDLGLDPEYTTVTQKERRVGMPDWDLVIKALRANGADGSDRVQLVLSMVDHKFPEVADVPWSEEAEEVGQPWYAAGSYLRVVQRAVGGAARVGLVLSGPTTGAFRPQW